MPFERPSLQSLIELAQATYAAKLEETSPLLARTPEFALCHVDAALADGNYAHGDYLARQILPTTCDEVFLAAHAVAERVPRKEGESVTAWRRRVVAARRDRVRGGEADYVRWALEVDGVDRAWTIGCWQGIGTVGVGFAPAGDYNRELAIPLRPSVQAALEAHVPFGVAPFALVPFAHPIDMVIAIRPNTDAVQAAIRGAISEWLRDFELGSIRVLLSQLRGVIDSAQGAGLIDHRVWLPWSDVDVGRLGLPTLGRVEFKDLKG